jgi:hypothetical protein
MTTGFAAADFGAFTAAESGDRVTAGVVDAAVVGTAATETTASGTAAVDEPAPVPAPKGDIRNRQYRFSRLDMADNLLCG